MRCVSRKLTLSRNLAFSAIVLAIFFVLLPRIVFGSAYADMRLVPYLIAVALLAIRFRGGPDRRSAQVLAVLGLAVLRACTARRQYDEPRDGRQRPEGQACTRSTMCRWRTRDHASSAMTCSEYWPMPRNSHLGAMVIVRREGFSNDQWVIEGVNLLDLKYTAGRLFRRRPVAAGAARTIAATALHRQIDKSLAALAAQRFRLSSG